MRCEEEFGHTQRSAKRQPPNGKEVEHTFRWSVRRAPWHRVRDADHMQSVLRETRSSQATGTHRQLTCHRSVVACRCVGRLEQEEGGGQSASQVLEFLFGRGGQLDHMNTRSRKISHLMLTFSSAREAQLLRRLHRRIREPHGPLDSSKHTLRMCNTELVIWAARSASCQSTPPSLHWEGEAPPLVAEADRHHGNAHSTDQDHLIQPDDD